MKRTYWKTDGPLDACSGDPGPAEADRYEVATEAEATLIGSLTNVTTKDGPMHLPVIDIDLPCKLIPSSTEGHFHLYIDHPMPWGQYVELLAALAFAGIVEKGYVNASERRGQTFVRKPGVKK